MKLHCVSNWINQSNNDFVTEKIKHKLNKDQGLADPKVAKIGPKVVKMWSKVAKKWPKSGQKVAKK